MCASLRTTVKFREHLPFKKHFIDIISNSKYLEKFLDIQTLWSFLNDVFGWHRTLDWTGFEKWPNLTTLARTHEK